MIPKFRAWDKIRKRMVQIGLQMTYGDSTDEKYFEGFHDFYDELGRQIEEVILMQSTGLKDKNGKEIFEGDIVRIWDNEEDGIRKDIQIGFVEYDRCWCVDIKVYVNYIDVKGKTHILEFGNYIEVLGNIHENPELLEGK